MSGGWGLDESGFGMKVVLVCVCLSGCVVVGCWLFVVVGCWMKVVMDEIGLG